MTTLPLAPLVCQHCLQRRHADCVEPRCECPCGLTQHAATERTFGLLSMLRKVGGRS